MTPVIVARDEWRLYALSDAQMFRSSAFDCHLFSNMNKPPKGELLKSPGTKIITSLKIPQTAVKDFK
jgi:hypothetical protein